MTLALLCLAALAPAPARAQEPVVVAETYRVPTVDGAFVSVEVRRPEGAAKVPVILTYSPYNILGGAEPANDDLAAAFIGKGYARAVADVLGTRNSSGCWDYGGPKEQQSGVDLVNFLAAQPWSNGKVGMIGGSYDGTTANMVAARPADAPGLAAIVPIAAISRWYGYAYYAGVRYSGNTQNPADEGFDTPLAFDYGLSRTPPSDPEAITAMIDRANPCDSVEHTQEGYSTNPDYDDFWLERDYRKDAGKMTVPALIAHGWQDFNVKQEEGVGMYAALKGRSAWSGLYLTQGPHGAPSGPAWDGLLNSFFDRFLAGGSSPLPARGAIYTTTRDSAGAAENPEALTSWPPPRTGDVELALGRGADGGTLGASAGDDASYTDAGTGEEVAAQDFGSEASWLAYTSEPVTADLRIAGAPALDATIEADRDHGHLTPTLWDVPAEGDPVPITRGFLNLAYRDSWAKGNPMPTGKPTRVVATLLPQDWIVRKGHRLVLTVASSNGGWAVPDQPGLGITVGHGGASRLLLPIAGVGPEEAPLPGAVVPTEALPERRGARLRVRLRSRGRRLRALVRAPRGARVAVVLRRGRRVVARRSVLVRRGRATITFRARRAGRYRAVVTLRTREGLVVRRSTARRVR